MWPYLFFVWLRFVLTFPCMFSSHFLIPLQIYTSPQTVLLMSAYIRHTVLLPDCIVHHSHHFTYRVCIHILNVKTVIRTASFLGCAAVKINYDYASGRFDERSVQLLHLSNRANTTFRELAILPPHAIGCHRIFHYFYISGDGWDQIS